VQRIFFIESGDEGVLKEMKGITPDQARKAVERASPPASRPPASSWWDTSAGRQTL
jgi:hypothetical protein